MNYLIKEFFEEGSLLKMGFWRRNNHGHNGLLVCGKDLMLPFSRGEAFTFPVLISYLSCTMTNIFS